MENLAVFVCDSLRYDYAHHLGFDAPIRKCLTSESSSDGAFTSLSTSEPVSLHRVIGHGYSLPPSIKTIFEPPISARFWTPTDQLPKMLGVHEKSDRFDAPPFVFLERVLDTHIAYGLIGHDGLYCDAEQARLIGRFMLEGVLPQEECYINGIKRAAQHIASHLTQLPPNTQVAIMGDHGEFLHGLSHNIAQACTLEVPVLLLPDVPDVPRLLRIEEVFPTLLSTIGITWHPDLNVLGVERNAVAETVCAENGTLQRWIAKDLEPGTSFVTNPKDWSLDYVAGGWLNTT